MITVNFELLPMKEYELPLFKRDIQEAFQKGFEDVYGKTNGIILPEQDIDSSLNEKGSIAYKAVVDGNMVGGAVVVIDKATQHNHLHYLFKFIFSNCFTYQVFITVLHIQFYLTVRRIGIEHLHLLFENKHSVTTITDKIVIWF